MSDDYGLRQGPNGLLAPSAFWTAAPEWIAENSNGCGPASEKVKLIPDAIFGVNFHDPCVIHDIMYCLGKTQDDKNVADRTFLWNCIAEINALHLSGVIGDVEHFEQMSAAWAYYAAVAEWGDSAFWEGAVGA